MLSSVRSSSVRPKESTYLSTLRFLSVSWAELKLDTTRVAIPRHLRTEEQDTHEAPGPAGTQPQGGVVWPPLAGGLSHVWPQPPPWLCQG